MLLRTGPIPLTRLQESCSSSWRGGAWMQMTFRDAPLPVFNRPLMDYNDHCSDTL